MAQQLPLKLGWADGLTLDNYFAGSNAQMRDSLRQSAQGRGERFLFLGGPTGTGKSHLLQAACAEAAAHDRSAAYLPLGEVAPFGPGILEGLESLGLVCIDDLDAVAGEMSWEEGLFDLYNRLREGEASLIMAADAGPRALDVRLEDLRSRLAWGLHYQLRELGDDEKIEALQLRAQRRGMELPAEAARYLYHRSPRDMTSLFALLERLDQASLAAQRRLTIPFIKAQLGLES